jgi:predicted RNase H-like nuclease (RuvC/YqgF family)
MDGGEMIGLVAACLIFGPGVLAVWGNHKRKMAELEIRKLEAIGSSSGNQLETLRRELAELRQTSTGFDLSLDANLQNLQQRIAFLEQRLQELESRSSVQTG